MGSEQTTETKKEIVNKTEFRNALHKSNKLINEISTSLLQKNLSTTSSSTTTKQTLDFTNIHAKGDIVISNVSQKDQTLINVSVLAETDLKEDLVQQVTNELHDKIKNLSESTQKQLEEQGEQIFASIVGDISDAMKSLGQSVTGGSSSDKSTTSLKNLVGVDNDTQLENLVQESVKAELVSETVNDLSTSIVGEQAITFTDIHSSQGKVVISDISQEILTEQIEESVQKSGLANNVIAAFSGLSVTEVENINASTQDLTTKTQSTLDAVGNVAEKTLTGVSGIISSSTMPFIILGVVVIVVAIVGLIIFLTMTSSGGGGVAGSGSGSDGASSDVSPADLAQIATASGGDPNKFQQFLANAKQRLSNVNIGRGSSTGIIIAVIVGIILLVVIIVLIWYFTKSDKSEESQDSAETDGENKEQQIKNIQMMKTINDNVYKISATDSSYSISFLIIKIILNNQISLIVKF